MSLRDINGQLPQIATTAELEEEERLRQINDERILDELRGRFSTTNIEPEAVEFVNRASVTGPKQIKAIADFVRLVKLHCPNIWTDLTVVPLMQNYGSLHPLGGGLDNFPSQKEVFRALGTTTQNADGIELSYTTNWANKVATPASITHASNSFDFQNKRWFIGHVSYNDATYTDDPLTDNYPNNNHRQGVEYIKWNGGTTTIFLGGYNAETTALGSLHSSGNLRGLSYGTITHNNADHFNSNIPLLHGVDFQYTQEGVGLLENTKYTTYAETPNSTISTGLWFYPQLTNASVTTGTLQVLVFIKDGIVGREREAANLMPIIQATLLSEFFGEVKYAVHTEGQSNAESRNQRSKINAFYGQNKTHLSTYHSVGGAEMSAWLGNDPDNPVRSANYNSGVFSSNGTAVMEKYFPPKGIGVRRIFDWGQGESDTINAERAKRYLKYLRALWNFVKTDFGSDLILSVMLIDYTISYRTSSVNGDFTISNWSGIDGVYSITAVAEVVDPSDSGRITNGHTPYSWTSGTKTIAKNENGYWEIKDGATLLAISRERTDHPALSSWADPGGLPIIFLTEIFSNSRTENIERVRQAQRQIVMENPKEAFYYDSRNWKRNLTDNVHMTTRGHQAGGIDYLLALNMIDGV